MRFVREVFQFAGLLPSGRVLHELSKRRDHLALPFLLNGRTDEGQMGHYRHRHVSHEFFLEVGEAVAFAVVENTERPNVDTFRRGDGNLQGEMSASL